MANGMPTVQATSPFPGATRSAIALTAIASILFVAFVAAYANRGAAVVDAMPARIAEVAMEEGARLAAAGDYAEAVRCYEQALSARFDHPEKRAIAERLLADARRQMEKSGR